jgi:hypothetical protein
VVQFSSPSTVGQAEALRDQFLQRTGLPFLNVLCASEVESTCRAHNHRWRARIYTPWITLNLFLAQILSSDHSCGDALERFQKYRKDCKLPPVTSSATFRIPYRRSLEFPPPLACLFTIWFPPEPKEGTVMIKDAQVRQLRQLLGEGHPLYRAALKVGMDVKSARKYRHAERLPSESLAPRTWRTREDPFRDVWPQLVGMLELNPGLQAKTLFCDLQRRFPGRFPDIQLRALQRKIKAWRATEGPPKEVFFDQVHRPGQLGASDFTHMNDLQVTLAGQPFDHMVYHFVLTYSNWENCTVCFSESFESLSQGLQNALWELGGVPQMHRTDRLTAAVNNLGDRDLFQQHYRALLAHYGLKGQAINARQAHENGDAEQSHNRFKTAVDQALILRGSRDFEDRAEYERFLRDVMAQRNSGRTERFGEDRAELRGLPARRVDAWHRRDVRVSQGSTIRIKFNTYSVPSRLIGEIVDVHVKVECLEVWHGCVLVERLPRLRGRNKHDINYRHVIDWLVRKPGAFAGYRYQDAMFPTSRFRRAYDALLEQSPGRAAKDYLRILDMAAKQSETGVDAVLGRLLEWNVPITPTVVADHLAHELGLPRAMQVVITTVDLSMYDGLLETREDMPLTDQPTCTSP